MKLTRDYDNYEDYINFQKQKTEDPTRRKKWLNEEWRLKIDGFKNEFSKLSNFLTPDKRCLCLGARTGQEVVALNELGLSDVVGIDIVPHEPHVILGDIHNLEFEDNSFDFVYTNIMDHSVNPQKMISEAERVLKVNGVMMIQIQVGIHQDEYTEFMIDNPVMDIVSLFNSSFCSHVGFINSDRSPNFAAMNFELIFQKDATLTKLNDKYGNVRNIEVPENYDKIWRDTNLSVQEQKLDTAGITDDSERQQILNGQIRRNFYLTRIAEIYDVKNIAEVGTAQGGQFYSFCEYASNVGGKVFSCDTRDVRSADYIKKFEHEMNIGKFIMGTSSQLASEISDIDLFYIDGSHDNGAVIADVINLKSAQTKEKMSVWIMNDFDVRFGCWNDIMQICAASHKFKVYRVGKSGSGQESHQALFVGRIS